MVQLSQLNVTTGKTIALTVRTFVDRVMSLLFSILARFVISKQYVIGDILYGYSIFIMSNFTIGFLNLIFFNKCNYIIITCFLYKNKEFKKKQIETIKHL